MNRRLVVAASSSNAPLIADQPPLWVRDPQWRDMARVSVWVLYKGTKRKKLHECGCGVDLSPGPESSTSWGAVGYAEALSKAPDNQPQTFST
eukprot:scaffold315841_cov19-Tisochrysis_lutea.AAC.2